MKINFDFKQDALIEFNNRETAVDYLKMLEKGLTGKTDWALHLCSNCKCRRKYKTWRDLPKRSIKCKHGNWFIKYTK